MRASEKERRAFQLEDSVRALREAAEAAMLNAYAPYSNFRVGAALLGTDGSVTAGCNVENAAYPAGICAERSAIASLVAQGVREFELLVMVTEGRTAAAPCGLCRQVIAELSPSLPIVSCTTSGAEIRWIMTELLPSPFTPASLDPA